MDDQFLMKKSVDEILKEIEDVKNRLLDLETKANTNLLALDVDNGGDTAPADDTSRKKITLQKLAAPPSNAAYIAASNNPGTDIFYLVIEES